MANTRCKPKGIAPLCACGCGQPTRWQSSHNHWSQYVGGHQNIGRPSARRIDKGEPPLCACGCGQPVKTYRYGKGWATYLNNHAPRKPHTPEAIQKMRRAAQARAEQVSKNNRNRVWTPESREKRRQAQLAIADQLSERFSGEGNPNWRNGHSATYHEERNAPMNYYQRDKVHDAIRERDGNRCVICRKSPQKRKLDVHHLDGNLSNNTPDNLVTLCRKHHMMVEFSSDRDALLQRVHDYLATQDS